MMMVVRIKLITIALIAVFFPYNNSQAEANKTISILFPETDTAVSIPLENNAGGVSLATADLGSDGQEEIIIGNGLGNEPLIRILRSDGSEIGNFLAYNNNMIEGINIAGCDLDGNNKNEIIAVPQRGAGPHLKIFDNNGNEILEKFIYNPNLRSGINLACGNLDDDQGDELVTFPAAGASSHVKIWKLHNQELILTKQFFLFDEKDERGVIGTVHDKTLTVASQKGGNIKIRSYIFNTTPQVVDEKNITLETNGVASIISKNKERILTTSKNNLFYNIDTKETKIFDSEFGSITAEVLNNQIIIVPGRISFTENRGDKSIVVDTEKQRLFAYENDELAHTFLVSTAKPPWVTPSGIHRILAKLPLVHYAWFYGSGVDYNYDLGWIPWNLRIYPHIYIHYAPWHNDFGKKVSHGCINLNLENAKWIYHWAEKNILVEVK